MHRTDVGSVWAWQPLFQLYCSKLKNLGTYAAGTHVYVYILYIYVYVYKILTYYV